MNLLKMKVLPKCLVLTILLEMIFVDIIKVKIILSSGILTLLLVMLALHKEIL